MANQNVHGIKRIFKAFCFSMQGFKAVWANEPAFRQEIILFIIATPIALFLNATVLEKLLLIGSLVLVLIVEMFNSAIEAVVDRIGLEHHELSGRAKDIGSASVLLALVWAGVTWFFIIFY